MKNTLITISIRLKAMIAYCITNTFIQVLASSWLIVLGAHTIVPFYPVPITLQTFFVALIGLMLPWKVALSSVALYVSYAAMGMPVLQGGNNGIAALLGPTAGYIAGCFFMVTIISVLMQHFPKAGMIKRLSFVLLGTAVAFCLGVTHLASLLQWNWHLALKAGVLPFVFSEPCKCILATYLSIYLHNNWAKK